MDNTNNKDYWEKYVTYWENKVREANQKENQVISDKTLDNELISIYTQKLDIRKDDLFLDFGCGSCRLFPYYEKLTNNSCNYFGVDIAQAPLEHGISKYPRLREECFKQHLKETDGQTIPFKKEMFDKIVCFGVLDACNQEDTVKELFRVLKVGGKLLVTGKNDLYFADDKDALIAEINARKKGHPNYFTNVHSLVKQFIQLGIKIENEFYFLRRGDFPNNIFQSSIPDIFYEWALIVTKEEEISIDSFEKFSDKYSRTFKSVESV